MEIRPVAIFRCGKKNPYEAAGQGSIDSNEELGEIQFHSGQQFEQALEDLEGFSQFDFELMRIDEGLDHVQRDRLRIW